MPGHGSWKTGAPRRPASLPGRCGFPPARAESHHRQNPNDPMRPRPSLLSTFAGIKRTAVLSSGGASIFLCLAAMDARAANLVYNTAGDFAAAATYGGTAPALTGDNITADGTFSITHAGYPSAYTLGTLNLNITSGAGTFTHAGGTLTVGTLGFGGGGGSRNPLYNMNGGALNLSTWTWGNGTNARFLQTAGTTTFSGTSLQIGIANGANGTIGVSGGTLNANGVTSFNLGTTANGTGNVNVSGGTFNSNAVASLYLGNSGGGNGKGNITASGTGIFNATTADLVLGQFASTAATDPGSNYSIGTVTVSDTAAVNVKTITFGGTGAASWSYGVLNLNGGTVTTGAIKNGAGKITPGATRNVVNANGGTVKANVANANFFAGAYLNLQSGGLTFDTSAFDTTITNVLNGTGGLTKTGAGTLTLSAANTYTGNTSVNAGELKLNTASLADAGTVTLSGTGKLNLAHGGIDAVASLTFGATTGVAGTTYGSSESGADVQNDTWFSGPGVLVVGTIPTSNRTLTWTGAQSNVWGAGGALNFLDESSQPTSFRTGDHVIFNNTTAAVKTVTVNAVNPGSISIQGSSGWIFQGAVAAIGGSGGITTSAPVVTLGGANNSFTGSVNITAGSLKLTAAKALGAATSVTIASGGQLDLNGQIHGTAPARTFTIGGNGPDGTGAIVDTTNTFMAENSGISNLVLTADASVSSVSRFDLGFGGSITGNGFTLTKKGFGTVNARGTDTGMKYVVESGKLFIEDTGTFGGATGSLLIKNSGSAGSFGTKTISVPVTIQSGGAIYNEGGGIATWNGSFGVAGNVTIDNGTATDITIQTPLAGTASITKTGTGRVNLTQAPGWNGGTFVEGGILSIGAAGLSDTGVVSVGNGAFLYLDFTGTDSVAALALDGTGRATGTWGSTASSAVNPDAHFGTASPGMINVLGDAASVWNGNGSDLLWTTGPNWVSGATPIVGATLNFAGTNKLSNTNDFPAGTLVSAMNFNADAGAFTLSGTGLNFKGAITNNSANLQTLGFPVNFISPLNIASTGAAGLTFTGPITSNVLQKFGTGVLTLGPATTSTSFATGYQGTTGTTRVATGGTFSVNGSYALIGGSYGITNGTDYSAVLDTVDALKFSTRVDNFQLGYTEGGNPTNSSSGVLNLGADSDITATTKLWIGYSGNQPMTTGGVVTVAAGGVANFKSLVIVIGTGKSSGSVTLGANATLNVSGATADSRAVLEVGNSFIGTSSNFSPALNASAGTFKGSLTSLLIAANSINGTTTGALTLGTSATNHLDVSGPSATLGGVVNIGRSTGGTGVGNGTLTIGNLDATSSIVSTDNGAGILVASATVAGKAVGVLNLNGGTLTITTTGAAIVGDPDGASTVNFNGTLLKAGAASSNWITALTNAVVGTGGANFDSNGFAVTIPQAFSGTGPLVKSGSGQLTLSATTGGWGGDTTVSAGTLSMKAAVLSNTGLVTIAGSAALNLDYSGSDTVKTLVINGVGKAAGTYTAVGNALPGEIADPHITGLGKLVVSDSSSAGNGYAAWATSNALIGNDALVTSDPDFDGIDNGIEFVTGGDPKVSSQAQKPTMTRDVSGNLVFVFRRVAAAAQYNPYVEYSTSLAPVWTQAQHGSAGVTVSVDANGAGSGIDLVTVTLPQALAGSGRLFARLHVTVTP